MEISLEQWRVTSRNQPSFPATTFCLLPSIFFAMASSPGRRLRPAKGTQAFNPSLHYSYQFVKLTMKRYKKNYEFKRNIVAGSRKDGSPPDKFASEIDR